jgi:site-specific DNA recombinase
VTRAGHEQGGQGFTKTSLHRLLTNVAYAGKVRHKEETYDGEHPALVDADTWQRVQAVLKRNGQTGGAPVRNRFGALLKGLIRCAPCGCAMCPSHTSKQGGAKRYRYYVCSGAQKRGWATCPSKSVPAAEVEQFVVERIKCVGRDPALLQETLAQARRQDEAQVAELDAERRGLEKDLARWHAEMQRLSGQLGSGGDYAGVVSRLADLQERIGLVERRVTQVREQIKAVAGQLPDEDEVAQALALFDPIWEALAPREQARVIQLLVERVDYDGAQGKVAITFHPHGIRALADELTKGRKEMIA